MNTTMTPSLRRFALTAHVTFSVGLLGSIAAFLVLAIVGLMSANVQIVRSAYPAMELIARFVIVPLAFAALLTGLIQSLGTQWGVLRHYWVLAKLAITLFATIILLIKMQLIGYAALLAQQAILPSADLHAAGLQLLVHAVGGLLMLLVPMVLSIYKPRGLTVYGLRMQQEQRAPLPQRKLAMQRPSLDSNSDIGVLPRGGSITITLRRTSVLRFIVIVVAVHMVVLHLVSSGLHHH